VPENTDTDFVQADAAHLPFHDGSFEAIIANHSLEHFENLDAALKELGRVAKQDGWIYVAVPDASTFTDRLYRWLANGGGHVNAIRSRQDLTALVERGAATHLGGGRSLVTSFSFLNRRNCEKMPRKLMLLGYGSERVLVLLNAVVRFLDRWLHTRLSLYGWALYFGDLKEEIDSRPWSNVCVRCGSGCASESLQSLGRVRRVLGLFPGYRCPACDAWNLFTEDRDYTHLQ
jgi:SAM-dependent methyltransferase